MTDKHIEYRSGYKYQLAKDCHIETAIKPSQEVDVPFIKMDLDGKLVVKRGYAWDGVSGPVPDTRRNLRASLVHDALYQLMRKEKLSRTEDKDKSDRLFQEMCKQDGVFSLVASASYYALKKFGNPATDPANAKKVKQAP